MKECSVPEQGESDGRGAVKTAKGASQQISDVADGSPRPNSNVEERVSDLFNTHYIVTSALGRKSASIPAAGPRSGLWQKHYMFCYSNENANSCFRLKKFCRICTLRKHVLHMHLNKLEDYQMQGCPLSHCREKLRARAHFLVHAEKMHGFSMSKHLNLPGPTPVTFEFY